MDFKNISCTKQQKVLHDLFSVLICKELPYKLQDIKSTHRSLAFLYTNNEKVEKEIKETIAFTIATKRIK